MRNLLSNKLVWLAVVIIAALGIWSGTKGDNNKTGKQNSSNGSSLSINSDIQNKCNNQISDGLFCKFAGAFANAGAYKVNATVNDNSGVQTLDLASDASGNESMVISKNGREQASIVVFNSITYYKDPTDGKWVKLPAGSNQAQITDLKKEFVKGDFNKNSKGQKISYKQVDSEACGSLTCYKYQITEPGQSGFLWFDNQSYLLRRVTIDSGSSKTDMNVTYENVSISEPSPIKNLQ